MSLISRIIDPRHPSLEMASEGESPTIKVNGFSSLNLFPTEDKSQILHDLNQPLQVLMSYIELVKTMVYRKDKESKELDYLGAMIEEVDYMAKVLRCLSPSTKFDPQYQNLSQLVIENRSLFLRTANRKGNHLSLTLDHGQFASVDALLVNRAVRNLINNAVESTDGDPQLLVRTRTVRLSNPPYGISPGQYVELAVCDKGPGMDKKTIDRLFEPFYTTKRQGHGLGLFAVLATMQLHKGTVEVRSAPGEGTQILLYFPRTEDASKEKYLAKN